MRAPIAGLLGRPARAKQLPAREREKKEISISRIFHSIDAIKFQAFEILFFFLLFALFTVPCWNLPIYPRMNFSHSWISLLRQLLPAQTCTIINFRAHESFLFSRIAAIIKASGNERALYKKHLFVVNGNGNDGGNNRARDTREIFKLCPVRCSKSRSTIDRSIVRSPRRKRKIGETRPVCRRGSILMKHELLLLER